MALVFGFTRAQTDGWFVASTVAVLGAAAGLLVAFVVIERRSSHPLLPLRVVLDRERGAAYLVMALAAMAMFGSFLFLTYYLQRTLDYSPLETGFAFLPVTAGIVVAAAGMDRLLPRTGPRPLMVTGLALAGAGFVVATRIGVHTSYVTRVLPAELVMGLGLGLALTTAASTALHGVDERDAGVASALLNASEQVGLSVGLAILNTVAAAATAASVRAHGGPPVSAASVVHGYSIGFLASALVLVVAVAAVVALMRSRADASSCPTAHGVRTADRDAAPGDRSDAEVLR
jgi:predicted MFS family arabinose efflux permease